MKAISAALRQFGLANGFLYLLNVFSERYARRILRINRYYFVAQPLSVGLRAPRRLQTSYRTKVLSIEDGKKIDFPRSPEVIENRFAQGSTCIAAFKDEQLAGYIWLHSGPYDEDEVRCRYILQPAETTIWDFDLFIAPSFRNTLAFIKVWTDAVAYLRARGIEWTISRVSAYAPDSLAAHSRMGAVRIGSAFFLIFRQCQVTLSSVPPYFHLSRKGRAGPSFILAAPGNS